MYFVYILENENNRHYIGCTKDIDKRLREHNSGKTRWTRDKGIWKVVYVESLTSREDAFRREKQIKSYKGGRAFKSLLKKA